MRCARRRLLAHSHDRHDRSDGQAPVSTGPRLALTAPSGTALSGPAGEGEPRSSYGTVPGGEFPAFVYVSVLAAFGWIILASWLAFDRGADAALALRMAVVLTIVFFGLPIVIRHTAVAFSHPKPQAPRDFLATPVDTATGPVSGASAWLQVLIIPLSLALAAALIGAACVLVR